MKLYANVLGQGKPFVILHGFLGMGDNWKTLGKQFAKDGYEVHLIDQRNHGKSPHSDEFSYELLAEDVKEYCLENNLSNIILMGHSMGGKTAMLGACTYPDLIEKLIVVDIAPKYYEPHHQEILNGLTALEQENLTSRGDAEDFLASFVPDKGTRLFLLKNLYWETKEKLALRINLEVLKNEVEEIGAALPENLKFSKPTLFVKGEKSNYIQEKDRESIKSHFSKAAIISIENAGHWVHAENMEQFYKEVKDFL